MMMDIETDVKCKRCEMPDSNYWIVNRKDEIMWL